MKLKFSDIKDELASELKKEIDINTIPGEKEFTLIDGFTDFAVYNEAQEISFGIPSGRIDSISIVGKNSGRIYSYALKLILPNFKRNNKIIKDIKNG